MRVVEEEGKRSKPRCRFHFFKPTPRSQRSSLPEVHAGSSRGARPLCCRRRISDTEGECVCACVRVCVCG